MSISYRTVAEPGEFETVIKKSRFIGQVFPVHSEDEALALLNGVRERFKGASHHVYGYIIKEQGLMRYSDAGEPQGTAGQPVLSVLTKEGLTDVLCVVTRYFGGTLLGAGGLTRAYSEAAAGAVNASSPVTMTLCARYELSMPYELLGRLRYTLEGEVETEDISYTDRVVMRVIADADEKTTEGLKKLVAECGFGQIEVLHMENFYYKLRQDNDEH